MRCLFSKRWMFPLRVAACFLVLTACQLTQRIPQPGEVAETPGAPAGPNPEAAPVDATFGPGPFSLENPRVSLPDLTSYKAILTISFDGTQAGQPSQWTHTYMMLASQDPAVHQVTVESKGGLPAPINLIEENGMIYDIQNGNDCRASATAAGSSLSATWEPAGFLTGVVGAEAAGSETNNGVETDQYTFDERALGQTGFTQSTGQVWVASENQVVIRYLLTTTAGPDFFGEGVDGTITWEYDLTDINQPVTIDLPAACTAGWVDAPLMPAAQDVRQQPGYTIYSISGSIQDVLAFYLAQLPALGWEAEGEPSLGDTLGWVTFVQGDQQLTVIVMTSDNAVEVRLLMETAPSQEATP